MYLVPFDFLSEDEKFDYKAMKKILNTSKNKSELHLAKLTIHYIELIIYERIRHVSFPEDKIV